MGATPHLSFVSMALDIRIAGRYRLGRKIGSGSFGDIYLGAINVQQQEWFYFLSQLQI